MFSIFIRFYTWTKWLHFIAVILTFHRTRKTRTDDLSSFLVTFFCFSQNFSKNYKDWFTFKIISQNNLPCSLECGVLVEDKGYRIRYRYDTNEIDVNHWENNNEVYPLNINDLPEKIKPFVLSLFRYLRRAFGKTTPSWCDRSNAWAFIIILGK